MDSISICQMNGKVIPNVIFKHEYLQYPIIYTNISFRCVHDKNINTEFQTNFSILTISINILLLISKLRPNDVTTQDK